MNDIKNINKDDLVSQIQIILSLLLKVFAEFPLIWYIMTYLFNIQWKGYWDGVWKGFLLYFVFWSLKTEIT